MGLQGKSAQRSPPSASAMLLLLLTSLAAAAMAQNENPIWFIPSGEKPSSQDEQTFCKAEQGKIADTELYQTRTSETLPPAVCIIFPFAPDTLRYGAGSKGDCHNKCCFFRPPSKNIPDAPPSPLWYEAEDSACNKDSEAISKPIILTGKNGEERTVCIQNSEGLFSPVPGATMACARGCCLFFAKEN